jgi:hypothetical protein
MRGGKGNAHALTFDRMKRTKAISRLDSRLFPENPRSFKTNMARAGRAMSGVGKTLGRRRPAPWETSSGGRPEKGSVSDGGDT